MLVTDYTSYAEIRASLGVSVDEIDDATLGLALYADTLQVELEDVALTLPAVYDVTKALPTPSDDEKRFLQAARLFATYAVARQLTTSLPLFGPEEITDGKAAVKRFADPFKKVTEAVGQEYARFRNRLGQAFAVVNSTTVNAETQKSYFSVVSPSTDPVTGA